jgi:hypothetical protein
VDRPYNDDGTCCQNLVDYGSGFFFVGQYNGYLAGSGPLGSPWAIDMVCPPWSPSLSCDGSQYISQVTGFNPSTSQIFVTPVGPTLSQ